VLHRAAEMTTPAKPTSRAGFGYYTAIATAVMTAVTFAIAIATPPLSGDLCTSGCFDYPYLDIGSRFPRDYYWMVTAIPAVLLYLASTIALYARTPERDRVVPQLGVTLAAMASLTLVGDYFVQLSVIQPAVLAGERDGLALLTQYNPHGVFIALEELGYLLTSVSLACMVPSLSKAVRLERAIRWTFGVGLALNMLASGWFLLRDGHARGVRLEIATITIDWLVIIVASCMLVAVFRRDLAAASRAS
jgi:hypothetical protein